MEIYKKIRRNSSLLLTKKTVVYIVNSQKQIFTEFSENTKIITLKKYIANYLNNKYIDILYNGHTVNNNLYINDLCRYNQKIKRLFFQVIDKKEAKLVKEEELKIKNYKNEINEINNNNFQLNNELLKLKKENSEKNLENKNSTEKCDNINKIYEKQEEEINELKKELSKINDNINEMNNFNMDNSKYLIENKELEIISKNKIKKSNSIVFLASTYTIAGKDSISKNLSNNKKQLTANILKKQRFNSIETSTINTNNNVSSNNSEVLIDSNNVLYTNGSAKKEENKKINIIEKDREKIKRGYNPKYIEFDFKLIDKDLSIDNNTIINSIKKWFTIFKYLDINEQLLFSIANKANGVCILYYWLYYLNNKIKLINNKEELISKEYSLINSNTSFTLPHFAKAAFKMLNNPTYTKNFEKPIDNYKDENNYLISTYKLLFQLTKILGDEDIINMEVDLFLNKMLENMKTKNGKGGPLGNYIQNIVTNQLDISYENVIKVNEILKKYNIDKMNTNEITKKDKTTGVISVIIKDILVFMGFFLDEKNKDEKTAQKYEIISEYKNNIILKEGYLENINKIKNIISNKYN